MTIENLDIITKLVISLNDLSQSLDQTERALKGSNYPQAKQVLIRLDTYRDAIKKQRELVNQMISLGEKSLEQVDAQELYRISNLIAQIAIMIREDAMSCIESILNPNINQDLDSEDFQ